MRPLSERSLLQLLAAVQFTHIMDFMIKMPLGPQLMRELRLIHQPDLTNVQMSNPRRGRRLDSEMIQFL